MRFVVFGAIVVLGFLLLLVRSRWLFWVELVVYYAGLVYYTLLCRSDIGLDLERTAGALGFGEDSGGLRSGLYYIFRMKTRDRVEGFWLNILLFIPMGYLLACVVRRWWKVVLACVVTSAVIEVLQGVTGAGLCDIVDVCSNSIGGCIGTYMAVRFLKFFDENNDKRINYY